MTLNKNQYYWLMVIGCFVVFTSTAACKGGKKAQQTTNTQVLKPQPALPKVQQYELPDKKNAIIETNRTELDTSALINVDDGKKLKASYNIAIMLPFFAQYYAPNEAYDSIPERSRMALEYYQGILAALKDLQYEGLALNINVYDTEKNEFRVKQLLEQAEMSNMDVIIGPVYNKPLKVVAEFAKQNNIDHYSPLSPSTKIAVNNPNYIITIPSTETHCAKMYDYIIENFTNQRIVTVCSSNPKERALASMFYSLDNKRRTENEQFGIANISQMLYSSDLEETAFEAYLSPTEKNILVLTSFNELLILEILSKLSILADTYDITVFGMPNWMKMESLDYEKFVRLNVHLTTPYWVDKYAPEYQQFRSLYFADYQAYPSEYACKAYDLMKFIGINYKKNGLLLQNYFNEAQSNGLFTNFLFQPSSKNEYINTSFTTDYFENKYINIIKFTDQYNFEKVN